MARSKKNERDNEVVTIGFAQGNGDDFSSPKHNFELPRKYGEGELYVILSRSFANEKELMIDMDQFYDIDFEQVDDHNVSVTYYIEPGTRMCVWFPVEFYPFVRDYLKKKFDEVIMDQITETQARLDLLMERKRESDEKRDVFALNSQDIPKPNQEENKEQQDKLDGNKDDENDQGNEGAMAMEEV